MGFCLFNTVAIAARYLQRQYGVKRIAIIDWDAHHGNGTEEEFLHDNGVLYVSTHQLGIYPGTGMDKSPQPHIIHRPIAPGPTAREEWMGFYRNELPALIEKFKPQCMLISCGFDAHAQDPLGSLSLESEDFGEMTAIVKKLAETWCSGRLISVLEGGYNLEVLATSACLHVRGLMRQ
jgi:acetoin utilization deacetylase AcuC-like enzyme